MLRRVKQDVLHSTMVPKKEIDVYCGLSETQKKIYGEMLERRLKMLQDRPETHVCKWSTVAVVFIFVFRLNR